MAKLKPGLFDRDGEGPLEYFAEQKFLKRRFTVTFEHENDALANSVTVAVRIPFPPAEPSFAEAERLCLIDAIATLQGALEVLEAHAKSSTPTPIAVENLNASNDE